jgi:hypothetical protein
MMLLDEESSTVSAINLIVFREFKSSIDPGSSRLGGFLPCISTFKVCDNSFLIARSSKAWTTP